MDAWEVGAREEIRVTLARFNHFGDSGRAAEFVSLFTEDGVLEISGGPKVEGREALLVFASGGATAPQPNRPPSSPPIRHHVTNVLIEDVTPTSASSASYFMILNAHGMFLWGRYRDQLACVDGKWLFAHRYVREDVEPRFLGDLADEG